jgi:hypothetical protein
VQAWDNLVDACKVISGKTILLLQIVYGAELKRIFAQAEATKKAYMLCCCAVNVCFSLSLS